ncbi:MAG TPA: thioredoxin domain-containing protein [Candidatus Acidoferrales bacterium]|nr:thioredoxin domain-containing protein [Candidatus Acidoferrales bacterium]
MNFSNLDRVVLAHSRSSRIAGSIAVRWLPAVLLCFLLPNLAIAQKSAAPGSPDALAVFQGQAISEDQLPAGEQAQLQRMMQQVFGVKRRALQAVLEQKLVENAAKKKGVAPEELIKSEVDSKVADPTDDEVSAYYQAHQGQITQPFDEIKDKIKQGLKDQEIQKARQLYVQDLMQQAVNDGDLVILLQPPKIEIPADPARLRGDAKAPVTIVEFADFSCPYCRQVEPTVNELLAKYPGKVNVAFRDFPLRQLHPQAQLAAEASRCAGEQGKYWEYHDMLFANAGKQTRDDLVADANALKLDGKQFDACLASGRYKPQIEQDVQLGSRAGIVATPAFFINGTFLNGAQPPAAFEKIIDEELSKANPKHSQE